MMAMTIDRAYQIIEQSLDGVNLPFAMVKEAREVVERETKVVEKAPSNEGVVFCEQQLNLF